MEVSPTSEQHADERRERASIPLSGRARALVGPARLARDVRNHRRALEHSGHRDGTWHPAADKSAEATRRQALAKTERDATVRLVNGSVRRAEIHWYEAHGVGKRGLKIKRFLD